MTFNQSKSEVYPTAVERSALWLYDKLHVDNLSDKCRANLVDTILFTDYPQPHPSKWLFTNKAGFICKKKEENMSFGNIRSKLVEIPSESSSSTNEKRLIFFKHDSSKDILDLPQYDKVIINHPEQYFIAVEAIQTNVIPKSEGAKYITHYQKLPTVAAKYRTERIVPNILCRDQSLCDEFNSMINEIVKFVEKNHNIRIVDMKMEFTISIDNVIWITNVPFILTISLKKNKIESKQSQSTPTLPSLTPNNNNNNINTTQSQSILLSSPNKYNNNTNTKPKYKCRGDFCNIKLDNSLPGIILLDSTAVKKRKKNSKTDKFAEDIEEYNNMEDLDENLDNEEDDIPKEITYKAVLLARNEKQFLYQNNNDELLNIDTFSNEWKSADDELQYKMKTNNPSQYYKAVTVCPHCYHIYEQIQKLRDNNFKEIKKQSPKHKKTMDIEHKTIMLKNQTQQQEEPPPPLPLQSSQSVKRSKSQKIKNETTQNPQFEIIDEDKEMIINNNGEEVEVVEVEKQNQQYDENGRPLSDYSKILRSIPDHSNRASIIMSKQQQQLDRKKKKEVTIIKPKLTHSLQQKKHHKILKSSMTEVNNNNNNNDNSNNMENIMELPETDEEIDWKKFNEFSEEYNNKSPIVANTSNSKHNLPTSPVENKTYKKVTELEFELRSLREKLNNEYKLRENLHSKLEETRKQLKTREKELTSEFKTKEIHYANEINEKEKLIQEISDQMKPTPLSSDLLKNMEDLQNQLAKKEKEWYNEKRQIIEDYNTQIKDLELKYNSQLYEPKNQLKGVEIRLNDLEEYANKMAEEAKMANMKLEETKERLKDTINEKIQLQTRNKTLEQSVKQYEKLISNNDKKDVNNKETQQYISVITTENNRLRNEFNNLVNEKQKDEETINKINQNINQLQIENQRLNQELADNKRKIKEISKEYNDYKSSRETNLKDVSNKIKSSGPPLQQINQLQESVKYLKQELLASTKDVTDSKEREKLISKEREKLISENKELSSKIVTLQVNINDLESKLNSISTDKNGQDEEVKNLKQDIEFLKVNLQNEISSKSHIENELKSLQQTNEMNEKEWNMVHTELNKKIAELEGEISLKDSSYNESKMSLETQIQNLTNNLESNKKLIQKTRDDYQLEQEKHQNTKQQLLQLEKDYESKQNELKEYIKQMENLDTQNTSNTLSLQYNLRRLESSKNEECERLLLQMKEKDVIIDRIQKEMLSLRNHMKTKDETSKKYTKLIQLNDLMKKKLENRMYHSFTKWNKIITVTKEKSEIEQKTQKEMRNLKLLLSSDNAKILNEVTKETKTQYENKIYNLTNEMRKEKEESLMMMNEDNFSNLMKIELNYNEKINKIKENYLNKESELLLEKNKAVNGTIEKLKNEKETIMKDMEKSQSIAIEAINNKNKKDLEIKLKEQETNIKREYENILQTLETNNKNTIQSINEKNKLEKESLLKSKELELNTKLIEVKKKYEEEISTVKNNLKNEYNKNVEALKKSHQDEINGVNNKYNNEISQMNKRNDKERSDLNMTIKSIQDGLQKTINQQQLEIERVNKQYNETKEELDKILNKNYENVIKEMKMKYEKEIDNLKLNHSTDLENLKLKLEKENIIKINGIKNENEKLIEELNQKNKEEYSNLNSRYNMLEDEYNNYKNSKSKEIEEIENIKQKLEDYKKLSVALNMRLCSSVLQTYKAEKNAQATTTKKWEKMYKDLQEKTTKTISDLQSNLNNLKNQSKDVNEIVVKIKDILLNKEKDVMKDSREQKNRITDNIKQLTIQRNKIEQKWNKISEEINTLGNTIRTIERDIRNVENISAISSDGTVNVEHAKKKLQLGQQYETLVTQLAEKQQVMNEVKQQIQSIDEKISKNEDELKKVESDIVVALVNQQRFIVQLVKTI